MPQSVPEFWFFQLVHVALLMTQMIHGSHHYVTQIQKLCFQFDYHQQYGNTGCRVFKRGIQN